MCQDDIKRQPIHRQADRVRASVIAAMLILCSFNYAQEAGFVSFISDTDLDNAIICSADGRNVYASGINTIVVFQRRDGVDTLEVIQVLNNDHEDVRDVHNVSDLALAPDGRYLYGVCQNQQTLLLFARDTTTGEIALQQVIQDSVFGRQRGTVPFVERNHKLLISPEGRHLYWFYSGVGLVAAFARDVESGKITKVQVLRNGAPELGGFNVPAWIAISPDGKHLYGAGKNGTTILHLSRNLETGFFTFVQNFDSGPIPGGRWDFGSVAVSRDSKTLYVTNRLANMITVFARNTDNGLLSSSQVITHIQPVVALPDPEGSKVYIRHFDDGGNFSTYVQNPANGQLEQRSDLLTRFGPSSPLAICLSPLGDSMYMTSSTGQTVIQIQKSDGKLEVLQHFDNNLGGTDRLRGSRAVEVSPDGRFLYVAARFEDAGISTFSRQQEEGTLSLVRSDALASLNAMVMAPDGRHLYVSSFETGTITVFAIDPNSGALQLVQTLQDSLIVPTYLEWGAAMVFSPEGSHLYLNDKMFLRVYHRNPQTGEISLVQKLDGRPHGLFEIVSMTLSPDGRNFYCNHVGNDLVQKIATFERNAQTGELSFRSRLMIRNVSDRAAMAIKVSPDGRHVYASTGDLDADYDGEPGFAIFKRDSISGELSLQQTILISGWGEVRDFEFSDDGRELYALISGVGYSAGLLAFFNRDGLSGQLTQRESFQSWKNGVYGMFDPADLKLSHDGRFLYVADLGGVATFATGRSNTTAVAENRVDQTLPVTHSLSQNYPNPFNPSTTIRFELPRTGKVKLAVYNLAGELVCVLIEGEIAAGAHRVELDARGLASGIYFYRLESEGFATTRKLAVIR